MSRPMRETILDVAGALFYREGIRAVGVDRVIEEADVAKATLYRHFPSKDHLVEAYLVDRHESVIAAMKEALQSQDESPAERALALFDMLYEKADSSQFRGCAFLLAVAEHEESERVTKIAREHKAAVRQIFRSITEPLGKGADELAAYLALLYEGALATVAVGRDPAAVLTAKRAAAALFRAAEARGA